MLRQLIWRITQRRSPHWLERRVANKRNLCGLVLHYNQNDQKTRPFDFEPIMTRPQLVSWGGCRGNRSLLSTLEIESQIVRALWGVERLTDKLLNLTWTSRGGQKLLKRCKLLGWCVARYLRESSSMDTKKPIATLQEVHRYTSGPAHLELERLFQSSVSLGLNEP